MACEVELAALDLRYESFRMKHSAAEARLLGSVAQRGIQEPLEGVEVAQRWILLNGFKRYRCARQLQIPMLPLISLGSDEAQGIIRLLRTSHQRVLGILEQAAFLDQLRSLQPLSVAELAAELSVSKTWVSLRLGLLAELSEPVRRHLFAGAFPVYSYMSTLRPFRRMNGVKPAQIEEFVAAVSGQQLSVREIEQLAQGYFRGPESFRQEIRQGNLALPLRRLSSVAPDPQGCTDFERVLLNDLELTQKYMQRVMGKSLDPRLKSRAFHAQSHLLTGGILSRARAFFHTLRQLYDRNGQA
jgi:hypothetical protein